MYFSNTEKILLIIGILISTGSFIYEVRRRVWIIMKGLGELEYNNFILRIFRVLREVILHERIIRDRFWPGLMHALVFWGFIVFSIITLDHFALGFGKPIMTKNMHHLYSYLGIPFSIFVFPPT